MASKGYMDKEIAEELNRTANSVSSKRYKEGIEQIKLNENIFDEWTNRNVWLIGFITADGSFNKGNNITIYNSEKQLVKEFKDIFQSQNEITESKSERLGNKQIWRTAISSNKIANFMKSINAYGNKNKRNPFPLIPDKYKWSFIKGLFDGDGNIYKGTFSIAGRETLIKYVYYWICQQIEKFPNKVYQSNASNKTYYFQIAPGDAIEVCELMQKNTLGTINSKKFIKLKNYYAAS